MRRPLNLWLLLVVIVCAVSVWAGSRGDLPFLGSGPSAPDVGESSNADPAQFERPSAPQNDPVHLAVLNGTGRSGLARQVGLLVPRAGCVAEQVGNAPGNAPGGEYVQSLLINRRLPRARAEALARRLGGLRLLTEWDDRCTEDAVLLLGTDHQRVLSALEE